MNDQQRTRFFSAYFSEIETIKRYVQSKDDLELTVPVDQNYRQWNGQIDIQLSVLEILRMVYDAFVDMKDKYTLDNNPSINPQTILQKTVTSIDWINSNFGLKKSIPDCDYGKFIRLIYDFPEGDYFDSDEYKEFQESGYRKIDLDLINEGKKRNTESVIKLLQQGANPYIDPEDEQEISGLLSSLNTDENLHFINLCAIHKNYSVYGYSHLSNDDCYHFLYDLYGVASSAEMTRIINRYATPDVK